MSAPESLIEKVERLSAEAEDSSEAAEELWDLLGSPEWAALKGAL